MKLLQRIAALAVAFAMLPMSMVAQPQVETQGASTAIDMTAHIDEQTAELLGESNTLALKSKVSKIITRNSMVDSEGLFALVPTITITDDGIVDTGMAQMRVVKAEFTLSVVNLLDESVFGSQSVEMQASGKDNATAFRQLISRINVNDIRFAKLLRDSQQSINDYYNRQMPTLIKKIETMMAKGEYEKAMAAMSMIPEGVEQYPAVCDMKVEAYNKMLENEVRKIVAEADLLVRQGKIDEALDLCRTANPASPNYGEIVAFLNRLDAQAAAAEAAAAEEQRRRADAERSQAMMEAAADQAGEQIKSRMADSDTLTIDGEQGNVKSPATTNLSSTKKRKSLGQILFGL